jgi:transcriptional regulator of nitric oxide reductase
MSRPERKLLKTAAVNILFVSFAFTILLNHSYSQVPLPQKKDKDITADLKFALPEADSFKKNKKPRYYTGYKKGEIIGYVFYTFDLARDIKGFNGPINLLVGTDAKKRIKNIKLLEHREYNFFIEVLLEETKLLDSFKNITHKDIGVRGEIGVKEGVEIKIGKDIFAETGASLSAAGIAKSIRKSLQIIDNCYVPKKTIKPVSYVSSKKKDVTPLSYIPKTKKEIASDLKSVLPEADRFEEKKNPRCYIGYKKGKIVGYIFKTFDLAKDIVGFNGPINLLVSTDKKGRIKNIKLKEHEEELLFIEDILLKKHKFLDSFKKNITHKDIEIREDKKIRIGKDIFAKTGATVTATGIAESVKKSLEIIDREYISKKIIGSEKKKGKNKIIKALKDVDIYFILCFFIAAIISFYTKNIKLRNIIMILSIIYLGFHKNQMISIINFIRLIFLYPIPFWRRLDFYLFFFGAIISSIFIGRIYCNYICPFGALQEWLSKIPFLKFIKLHTSPGFEKKFRNMRYIILLILIGGALIFKKVSFASIEPFGTTFSLLRGISFSFNPFKITFNLIGDTLRYIALVIILAGVLLKIRFWCRYFCAVGAILAFLENKLRFLKIRFLIKRWRKNGS